MERNVTPCSTGLEDRIFLCVVIMIMQRPSGDARKFHALHCSRALQQVYPSSSILLSGINLIPAQITSDLFTAASLLPSRFKVTSPPGFPVHVAAFSPHRYGNRITNIYVLQVFNLTEPKRALRNEHKHVKEVGWAQNLAPPLEKLCSVCKEIDSWLSGDQHRIAVLHAR